MARTSQYRRYVYLLIMEGHGAGRYAFGLLVNVVNVPHLHGVPVNKPAKSLAGGAADAVRARQECYSTADF